MNKIVRIGVVGAVAIGPLMGWAQAQENYYSRDKYTAVLDRQQPEYDPDLIRLGGIVVNANAQAGVTSISNVFATNTNEESDTILRVGAEVNARTDWSNHQLGIEAAAFQNEYLDIGSESNSDLLLRLRGRADVTDDFSVTAIGFTRSRSEDRTSFATATGSDRPVEVDTTGARLEAAYNADRTRLTSFVEVSEIDYQDVRFANGGGEFDQDFRDRTQAAAQARLSYALSPDFAVFGQAGVTSSEYDQSQIVNNVTQIRDADGYTLAGGANFELQSLLRGDIAIGYLSEDRKDPNLEDIDGLSVDAALQWFPSRLTTVSFNARRSVQDFGLVEAVSATQLRFGARIDHELKRNIILSAETILSNNEYTDIDRDDEITEFALRGRYKLNRNVHAEAFVRRSERSTSGTNITFDPSYTVDLIGIGLTIYPQF